MLKKLRVVSSIVLLIAFDYLFWSQTLGLNALIFTAIAIPALIAINRFSVVYINTWIAMIGTLLSATLVVLYNSGTAKVAYLVSFALMIGFIHQPSLRTVYHATLTALAGLLKSYANYWDEFKGYQSRNRKLGQVMRYAGLSFAPLIIVTLFYWIFKVANPVFDEFASKLFEGLWDYISNFLAGISFAHVAFLFFGLAICSLLLFNRKINVFTGLEVNKHDFFRRVRRKKGGPFPAMDFGEQYKSLKNEFRVAVLTMLMVNALLLVVNVIDVNWIWFNFEYSQVPNLSQFVHEGTYLLILSILISMAIILHFFRGNLNLLKYNRPLKIMTYAWIIQNIILVVSVAIRNYHYIHEHGLAYKRIGVGLFLILVFVGLMTLIVKIHRRRSSFYLFRVNSWAIYFVMLFASIFNWDVVIARHNLHHSNEKNGIDTAFLLSLSDKTLYLLHQNRSFFKEPEQLELLDQRIEQFLSAYPETGWQSFTMAESVCYSELMTNHK